MTLLTVLLRVGAAAVAGLFRFFDDVDHILQAATWGE